MKRARLIYLAIIAVPFTFFFILVAASGLILWRSAETWPIQWVAKIQQESGGVWSGLLSMQEDEYKEALYRLRKAEIVVIGTSRSIQLREDMFVRSFVNMGRGLNQDAPLASYKKIRGINKPKLVLWVYDNWLLSESLARRNDRNRKSNMTEQIFERRSGQNKKGIPLVPQTFYQLWIHVLDGKIGIASLLKIVLSGIREGECIGLRACVVGDVGYAPDGSQRRNFNVHSSPRATAQKLTDEVERVVRLKKAWQLGLFDHVSKAKLTNFVATLDEMKRDKIKLVVVLPPFPPSIARMHKRAPEFKDYNNSLVWKIKREILLRGFQFHDFTNPTLANVSPLEFFDAIHPKPIAMAKVIKAAASSDGSFLQNQLDLNYIERLITQ
jgi:hypothetical protein